MYSIWDLDLYLYNNIFWDTRPTKMEKIYENYTLKLNNSNKYKIWRILQDIVINMNISTMKYYTANDWSIIEGMTKIIKEFCENIKFQRKIFSNCTHVCHIVKLAVENTDVFVDKETEKYFWRCIVSLCESSYFDTEWYNKHHPNDMDEETYFIELVHSLYLRVLHNEPDEYFTQIIFESQVIVLFYLYKKCLKSKIGVFAPVFPETTINNIKNVKDCYNMQIGETLLDMISKSKDELLKVDSNTENK